MYRQHHKDTSINSFRISLLAVFSIATLMSAPGKALESDGQQEVQWSSDGGSTMRLEGNTRILELTDNVKVTQGTLQVTGDQATFEYDVETNLLLRVTVQGQPVNYQQQLDSDGAQVTGRSRTLLYYQDDAGGGTVLELIGDAVIASPDTTMNCAAIVYLADQDLIREAEGPCQGSLRPSDD
jgi:lipopolysaccharide transport protein LptA